jgi:SAM-dependent methyltransferase
MSQSGINRNRMYNDLAYLWPLISPPDDYATAAKCWRDTLREKLGQGQHEILELGVGGGNNLSHLTKEFKATAVDMSEQMLSHSQKLNPEVEHHMGDMRTVHLGKTFDAVLIHDAISYMLTEEDLMATFETASKHLKPGGIFITAPDWYKETFKGTHLSHTTRTDGSIELTFIEYHYDPDPHDTTIEVVMLYLIRENGFLRIEQDLHILGLFSLQKWLELMTKAGFTVEKQPYPVHDDGREAYLLVGSKR